MEMDETLEETAARELEEETGLKGIELKQFRTFSQVDRDPRTRISHHCVLWLCGEQ
jgi:8-oxo-dGTP diphosphatase